MQEKKKLITNNKGERKALESGQNLFGTIFITLGGKIVSAGY
jgi:hypothetical protein